jgi:CHAD domain-containing protein
LKNELRWLAGVLGEARNLDVLLSKAKDTDLSERLGAARVATYNDAVDALESSRARALMLDLNEWLECGDYLYGRAAVADREQPAVDFSRNALQRLRKRLKKDGRDLLGIDDEQRHEVRKDAKKLRYAAEFFGSLLDDRRSERRHAKFIAGMEDLQDQLGALNDLATGPEVLDQHGLSAHSARDEVVSHANKAKLIDKAQSALDEVVDTKPFWK